MIRKEATVSGTILQVFDSLVSESDILNEDDGKWPGPDRMGRQELEIVRGCKHIAFCTSKISSSEEIENSLDPYGLRCCYYLIQDLKCLVLSLVGLHFKIKP